MSAHGRWRRIGRSSGTVTNAEGKPIAGATVLVEGTSTGTTTNTDGKFSVSAPANGTLAVSFIGYETVKVAIAGKTQVNVSLREDTHAIDDVIVVAYGTAKKESFTGSVAVVKSEELEHRKVSNVTKALDGLAPRVQVTSGSGQPVRVRRSPSAASIHQRLVDSALCRGRNSL